MIYIIEEAWGIVHTGIKDRATFTLKEFPAWKVRLDVPSCLFCVASMRGPW